MEWHRLSIENIFTKLNSSLNGIEIKDVQFRLEKFGFNEIKETNPISPWLIFFHQFNDFMIIVLVAASIISGIIGDLTETIVILIIVLINAIIGFFQEYGAEKSLFALRKMATPCSIVIRNQKKYRIPTNELLPGDIVILSAGDIVPADIRLIEIFSLKIDESTLTGESIPVEKSTQTLIKERVPLAEISNMVFKGTKVTQGRAKGIAVETGMTTELGKIAGLLDKNDLESPLKLKMTDFSKKLTFVIFIICFLVFLMGWLRGEAPLSMLLISISLAVAAIPESLPTLITIALVYGANKLMKKNALIRKLPAVETLGSVSVICTDKTGTLTLNKMKVVRWYDCNYPNEASTPISNLLLNTSLNHNVHIPQNKPWIGDPTEIALVEYAKEKLGEDEYNAIQSKYPTVSELPFDSDRKCMSTIHAHNNKYIVFSKGSIESISAMVLEKAIDQKIVQNCNEWAENGIRVLAFAYKEINELPSKITKETIECNLIFSGLLGLMDPPREEVYKAIEACKNAGIKPVMITGDHPATAEAVAKIVGIWNEGGKTITGSMLDEMDEEIFLADVKNITVYARVSAEQKLKIIKAFQYNNHFLAMTGDGVNDAPSLKSADIGIAMGICGTEVSKEASDMILLDDNFSTIVNAVEEGRIINDNIKKFIKYIITCNSAEIWIIFFAPFLGLPIPLMPIQILWINLITDAFPGLALVNEKAEIDIMNRPPRPTKESLFAGGIAFHIVWVGIFMAALTLGLQGWEIHQKNEHWQTMVFTVLSFCQLAHVLAIRSDKQFLIEMGVFSNLSLIVTIILTCFLQLLVIYLPFANRIFKTQPLTILELTACFAIALLFFHVVEFEKLVKRRRATKK